MSDFVDTELGRLPKSWEVAELKDKAESFQYGTSVKCSYGAKGKAVLRIPNVVGGAIDIRNLKFGTPKSNELGKLTVKSGDLLFVRTNGVKENAGRCSRFDGELDDCYFASYLIRVRLDPKILDPVFLGDYTRTELGTSFLSGRAIRTADGKFNINSGTLKTMLVPVPPIGEQKKIAHILSTVQRAIEEQERIIQTTTELKKALMHKLFTEGLRNEPQKQTEIGPVPKSWDVVKLSSVCSFQSGGTPSKQNPEFWEGTIPWVSPKDMKRPRLTDVTDHISQEALESGSKLAPAGSIFVVVRGMILAKTVPVALAEVPMAINQDMKAIVPGTKLRSDFLLYALETLRGALFKKVGRAGHGTATLMSSEIANFKIPLPDLNTQHQVAAAIHTLETKKELHEQKLAHLQNLFRTLLHELMTAKLRAHPVKSLLA